MTPQRLARIRANAAIAVAVALRMRAAAPPRGGFAGTTLDVMEDAGNAVRCQTSPKGSRVARAKAAFKPAGRLKQQQGIANERRVSRMVRGRALDNNEPMDVLTTINGRLHGIEVKTFIDNGNDKITIRSTALRRKRRWSRKNKATIHTVVVDDRDVFSPDLFSGHKVYYLRGTGSFRLRSMIPVRDEQHLLRLMAGGG